MSQFSAHVVKGVRIKVSIVQCTDTCEARMARQIVT